MLSPQIFCRLSRPRLSKFWLIAENGVFQQHPRFSHIDFEPKNRLVLRIRAKTPISQKRGFLRGMEATTYLPAEAAKAASAATGS
jgi:hypothetical protein